MSSKSDKVESYKFIKKILIDVQDLNKNEQIAYIKKSCESSPELLPSLMNMLNIGNSELAEVMEKPAILEQIPEVDTQLTSEEPSLPVGTKVSHYKIIEKVGSGGMGNVYAAQQNFPAQRKVALKLLKKAPNQQLLITETQILARLNHPNIATLFEIDKTEDGQLFIAMEFINGEDIISWCKNQSYCNVQIIKLFLQLCSGINYAHEQNIIHCDIKPSNVLVTDVDGSATVKIIDFGISQFEDQQESYHEISGTPAYLAPEVLSNKDAMSTDVRRDVYALGVLLKKLLPTTVAIDLHAIIDKATAFDKEQRYQTPADLNKDLNRYLKKQTVSARESNVWYITKLLIQRRFEVFLIIATVLLLSLTSAFFAQRNQAKIATQQAQAAKIAQHEAEELTGFLTDLFEIANPERSKSDVVTAIDLLDKAKEKLMKMESVSLSDARFMHTIGSIYIRMGQLENAKILIVRSLEIKKNQLTDNDNEIIIGYTQLGLVSKKLGEFDESEKLLLTALKLQHNHENPDEVQLAYIHNHLGNLYTKIEQTEKSIEQHKLAIALRQKQTDNKLLADSYNNLGVIYNNNNQWDLASQYFNLSLEIYLIKYDEHHPYIGIAANNLAYIEEQRFNWRDSERLYNEARVIFQNAYGPAHSSTIAAQFNLALYYGRRLQLQKSVKIYDGLIEHFKLLENTEQIAKYMTFKAHSFVHVQQYAEAKIIYQDALKLVSSVKIKEKYLYAKIHTKYGELLLLQGDFVTAQRYLQKSLRQLESNYALDNPHRFVTLNFLADAYYKNGDVPQSAETYQKLLNYNKPKYIYSQREQVRAHIGLARVYYKQELFKKSETELNHAMKLNKGIYSEQHKSNAIIYYEMAQLNISQGNITQARELLNLALKIQKRALPTGHIDLLSTENSLKSLSL